jgi:putative inorganic carbon (HCO3(-)) transporter
VRAPEQWLLGLFLVGLAFSITLAESALVLLALPWLWKLRHASTRTTLSFPLAGPVLALVVTTLLASARSANPAESFLDAKGLLLLVVLYVLVDALQDVDAADRFLTWLFLLLAVHAGLSVIQVALCPPAPVGVPLTDYFFHRCDRAHGFYSIYMTLAGVLSLVLLATLPRLLSCADGQRAWTLLAWLLSAVGFLLTLVRGAWVGFLAGVATLSILLRRLSVVLAMGAVLVLLLLLPAGTVEHRIRSFADPADPTMRERLFMWQSGLRMVQDHPLTGVGPGQVKALFPQYALPEAHRKSTSHVHNTPLQIAAERGLLGLAAWLWLWVAFFREGIRLLGRLGPDQIREQRLVAGSLAALLGFLVAGLFEYNFGSSVVVLVAYTVMALPFIVERSLALRSPRIPRWA